MVASSRLVEGTGLEDDPGFSSEVSCSTGCNAEGGSKTASSKVQDAQSGFIAVLTSEGNKMTGFRV
jgi:hypothetical protein